MAVYKEDFLKVGFFEERFSGGDYEWSQRAVNKGMNIVFVPNALVYHPTRKTFKEILKKEQRIAYGIGNHWRLNHRSYILLILIYILKIFKVDTNIRYTIELKKRGIKKEELREFNIKFIKIRLEQVKFVYAGYKFKDVRRLELK